MSDQLYTGAAGASALFRSAGGGSPLFVPDAGAGSLYVSNALVAPPPAPVVPGAWDTFTRADSALTMGNAESGQTWTPYTYSGTVPVWGIDSNRAYLAGAGTNPMTRVDSGLSDGTYTANILMPTNATVRRIGLTFRALDDLNQWRLDMRPAVNVFRLYSVEAGTETQRATAAPGFTDGATYEIKVVLNGTSIEIFRDGVSILSVTSSINQSGTGVGLWVDSISNQNGRFLDIEMVE